MRSGDERTLNPPIPHPQREVPKELAEEYAKESNILFMEVSAKTKENIDLIFETIGFPSFFSPHFQLVACLERAAPCRLPLPRPSWLPPPPKRRKAAVIALFVAQTRHCIASYII